MGEANFFPDAQNFAVLSVLLSTHAARKKPLYPLLQDMVTAGMLRYGACIHRQHDEAPQVGGLLSLAEKRNRVGSDVGCCVPLQAQVVLARQFDGKFLESDLVSCEERLYRSEVVDVG